jgi:hypothetical protein
VSEVHHYGDTYVAGEIAERSTIHGSSTIDIQIDSVGRVVAVWFRCRTLPFKVSMVQSTGMDQPPIKVTAIEYVEDT